MFSDRVKSAFRHFLSRTEGNVAILFGLASVGLFLAVGGGVELSRAYDASQKLNQVADLACQYASRPSQVQLATSAPATYTSNVKSYIGTSLTSQRFGFTQTNATPFTYTKNGAANVNLASTVPTLFAGIVHITTIPISAAAHCYDTPSSIPQRVPNNNSNLITQEGFENTSVCPSSGFCYVSSNGNVGMNNGKNPDGSNGTTTTPSSSASTTPSYTGSGGTVWYVTGYCVEIDHAGAIKSTVPEGFYSAELDCDNGSGSAGNSSISTNVYLPTGSYELRYNYVSRVDYPNYDPTYICGSTASDVSWANDTNSSGGPVSNALRTNQVNVYLDPNTGPVPTHLTIDGSEHLAGSNLIDVCVYAQNWIERSVRINVTTAGYYWLSFAADGQNDSYGGQIDNIRLCNGTCANGVQDNFPTAWSSTSTPLFEDTFESPTYANSSNTNYNTAGNLNVSTGTSGTSASGWPKQTASGWATGPVNQVDYILTSAAQGSQSIMLDAGSQAPTNRLTSRSFLLDPGYYRVDYDYISNLIFSGSTATYCASSPNAAAVAAANRTGSGNAYVRFYPSYTATVNSDTNILGAFMSHAQLASTPVGGGALNSTTSYNNPNGSTSTTPTVSPAAVSLTNYNTSQVNPLIDICTYASGWQARTAYIQITKAAYYWLTFAALGTGEGAGGGIDDVRLTDVGSLYMSSPPSTFTPIPVPDPQPGTAYTNSGAFSGFSITADPLTVPAP